MIFGVKVCSSDSVGFSVMYSSVIEESMILDRMKEEEETMYGGLSRLIYIHVQSKS